MGFWYISINLMLCIRTTFLGKSMSCIQCSSLNPCPETAREKARSCTIVHANKSGFYPCKLQFIAKTRICTDQPRQARHRGDADGRGQLSRSSLAISTQIRIFFSSVLSWFLRCDIKVYLCNLKYGWTAMILMWPFTDTIHTMCERMNFAGIWCLLGCIYLG